MFRVSKRMRKLHVPVIRCQGKKHDNYLLVLMLFVDNCYYTTVRITIHKTQELLILKHFGQKKDLRSPISNYYVLSENKPSDDLIHNSEE